MPRPNAPIIPPGGTEGFQAPIYRVKWPFIIPTPILRPKHQTHHHLVPCYQYSLEPVSVFSVSLSKSWRHGFLDRDNLTLLHFSAESTGKIVRINFSSSRLYCQIRSTDCQLACFHVWLVLEKMFSTEGAIR